MLAKNQTDFKSIFKDLALSFPLAFGLFLLVAGSALLFNNLRSNSLPLFRRAPFDFYTDCPEILGDLPEIDIKDLPKNSSKVVFMDASMAKDFAREHIPGALFMPMYPIDTPDFTPLKKLPKGTWIVVYGSKNLQSDERLITALMNQNVRGIHLLKGGIKSWKKAKRKVDSIQINHIELNKIIIKNTIFVDSRNEDDYTALHVKDAINIPFDEELPPDKKLLKKLRETGSTIVVYGENNSKKPLSDRLGTYFDLKARGIKNLYILNEDFKTLKNSRLSLVKGEE